MRRPVFILPLFALLLFASSVLAQPDYQENQEAYDRQYIQYLKETPVATIDPALPKIPFEKWFRDVAGKDAEYKWEVNDCGENPGYPMPGIELPFCVEADAKLPDGRLIYISIMVGIADKGLSETPVFFYGGIEENGKITPLKKLSQLQDSKQ